MKKRTIVLQLNPPEEVKEKMNDDSAMMSGSSGSGSSRKRGFGIEEEQQDKQEVEEKSKNPKIEHQNEHGNHKEEALDEVLNESTQFLAQKVFLNGLIMKEIIQYLPSASLKNLRSTCVLWNQLMLPLFRAKNHKYLVINTNKLEHVTAQLKSSPGIPFYAYAFTPEQFSEPSTSAGLQELISLIAPITTQLKLTLKDSAEQLHLFASGFPSLESLYIVITGQTLFPEIWSLWPTIEFLNAKVQQVEQHVLQFDSWLTGIPISTLSTMRWEEKHGNFLGEGSDWNLASCKTNPGFSDLKFLREFYLQLNPTTLRPSTTTWGYGCDEPIYISDLSGYYGFAATSSSQLRRISIDHCGFFSDDCTMIVFQALVVNGTFTRPRISRLPIKNYSSLKNLLFPPQ